MTISQAAYRSVAELAQGKLPSQPAFHRIFNVQAFDPACRATPELALKYGEWEELRHHRSIDGRCEYTF